MTPSEDRPDYVTCIRKGNSTESLCGRSLFLEFAFVDREHARSNEAAGGRLVTCEDCRACSEKLK
jgi:hypothetical protein